MEVNERTVYDYYSFCREVCYVIVTNSKNGIGEGKIVKIDEFHIYIYILENITEEVSWKMNENWFGYLGELRKTAITVLLK